MEDRSHHLGFSPPHPGEYLREDILPSLGMTNGEFATHIGVTRQSVSRLVNERADVSIGMAIRLGQAFKNGARFWLALQNQYDIWKEEEKGAIRVDPLSLRSGSQTASA